MKTRTNEMLLTKRQHTLYLCDYLIVLLHLFYPPTHLVRTKKKKKRKEAKFRRINTRGSNDATLVAKLTYNSRKKEKKKYLDLLT